MKRLVERSCTCHPDDHPPVPCPRKFALTDCRAVTAPSQDAANEIERLRDALKEIAAKDKTGYARGALGRIARAALAENGDR